MSRAYTLSTDPTMDYNGDGWVYIEDLDGFFATMTDPGEPPITLYTSAVGNPYFFTGRRLHLLDDVDATPDTAGPNRQIQYNRARHYRPDLGRWLQRDPAEYVDGMNLYEYVRSSPVLLGDPFGEWGADVHRRLTFNWALESGMTWRAADAVSEADIDTDGFRTGYIPVAGQQSRHFNRNSGGGDSRMWWRDYELATAKIDCNAAHPSVSPSSAATHLGRGLHSVQDWWAHGEYSSGASFVIEPHSSAYDNWELDAVSQNGRPTPQGRAPQYFVPSYGFFASETSWPTWASGNLRQNGTRSDSIVYVRRFLSWVRSNGACECKDYFLQ